MTITEDTAVSGEAVRVEHADGHYRADRVFIDGAQVTVLEARRYRDGGTTVYVTDAGTLTLPHRLGDPDRTPRWRPS